MYSLRKGFTLVEILVVLALIGLFAAATSYLTHDSRIAQTNVERFANNINDTIRNAKSNMILGKGVLSGSTLVTADERVISISGSGISTIYGLSASTNTGTETSLQYPFYDNDKNYQITDISVSSGVLLNGHMPNWDMTGVTAANIQVAPNGTLQISASGVSTKINILRVTASYNGFQQSIMLDRIMGRSEVVEGLGEQLFVTTPASVTAWTPCANGNQTRTCTEQSGGDPITCTSLGAVPGLNNQTCGTPAVCDNSIQFACSVGASVTNVANSCGQNSTWGCNSTDGGTNTSPIECSIANAACINGTCNPVFNSYVTPTPTCAAGDPTLVTGTGPWTWGCNSPNGGTNTASGACSANLSINCVGSWSACSLGSQTYTISTPASNGGNSCESTNGNTRGCGTQAVCSAPFNSYTTPTPTCAAGTPTVISGTGPWTWGCISTDGGTNTAPAACTANRSIDGGWSGWSACSGGNQSRTCTNPTPSGGGASCGGASSQSCGTPASVTAWSACSGGNQSRTCTEATGGGAPTCASLGAVAGVNNQSCGTPASCNNSIQFLCASGNPVSTVAGSCGGSSTWGCNSADGGTNTTATACSRANNPCPITGVCSGSPGSCTYGAATDNGQTSCNTTRQWTCNGANGGGASPTCSTFNGACCVPNGSCSASSPVCTNLTTYGTDNCGNSCSLSMSPCTCAPGSDAVWSNMGTNYCSASWPGASLGATLNPPVSSSPGPGGSLVGTCVVDGPASTATTARWNYGFTCPDAAVASCNGGGWGVSSPNGSNYCAFSVGTTNVGTSVNLNGSGNPAGTATATCNPGPTWSYSYNCPNTAGATCAGGATWFNTCYFTWAPQTQGFSSSAWASPGNGFVQATCNSSGGWDITTLWCL